MKELWLIGPRSRVVSGVPFSCPKCGLGLGGSGRRELTRGRRDAQFINDIQKKWIQNLIHSLSSIGPSVSMEMPLAKDYLGVSNIMEWFNSFLVSKNQLASTRSNKCFKKIKLTKLY